MKKVILITILTTSALFAVNASNTNKCCHETELKSDSFRIIDVALYPDGRITWKSNSEREETKFTIQQFKWGQWVTVKRVDGKGGNQPNEYADTVFLTSGKNKFRIVTYYLFNPPFISDEITVVSTKKKVGYSYIKKTKEVIFSETTAYAVKNKFGENVLEGLGNSVNLSKLGKGDYIVAYDNTYIEIKR